MRRRRLEEEQTAASYFVDENDAAVLLGRRFTRGGKKKRPRPDNRVTSPPISPHLTRRSKMTKMAKKVDEMKPRGGYLHVGLSSK